MVARISKHAGGFDVVQLDTANKRQRYGSAMRGQETIRLQRQGRRAMSRDAQGLQVRWSGKDQPGRFRRGRFVAGLNVRPVDDVPERLDVVRLDVLVLQVESVLPHVDLQQWDDAERDVGLLVVELEGQQPAAQGVVAQDGPARALQAIGGRTELSLELVERPELVVDRRAEIAGRLVPAVRR